MNSALIELNVESLVKLCHPRLRPNGGMSSFSANIADVSLAVAMAHLLCVKKLLLDLSLSFEK